MLSGQVADAFATVFAGELVCIHQLLYMMMLIRLFDVFTFLTYIIIIYQNIS